MSLHKVVGGIIIMEVVLGGIMIIIIIMEVLVGVLPLPRTGMGPSKRAGSTPGTTMVLLINSRSTF